MNRRRSSNRFSRLAILSAMAAALALAGCGRKGGLELPPAAASAAEPAPAAAPEAGFGVPTRAAPSSPDAFDDEGRPVAQKGKKRPLPIDWLLD